MDTRKAFFIFLTLFSVLIFAKRDGELVSPYKNFKKTDLYNVDYKIESLENLKDYYLSKAARLRLHGDRMMFQNKHEKAEDAQKKWKLADHYDMISDQIQEEIDNLQKERIEILESRDY